MVDVRSLVRTTKHVRLAAARWIAALKLEAVEWIAIRRIIWCFDVADAFRWRFQLCAIEVLGPLTLKPEHPGAESKAFSGR